MPFHTLSTEQMKVAKGIGATEADQYGNGRGIIRVPCAIAWNDGSVSDPSLLLITKKPPIYEWQKRVRLFRDVSKMSTSDYALPMDVRLVTLAADEIRMGFAPTRVVSVQGRPFVLDWSADMFRSGEVKGKDIRLRIGRFSTGSQFP